MRELTLMEEFFLGIFALSYLIALISYAWLRLPTYN